MEIQTFKDSLNEVIDEMINGRKIFAIKRARDSFKLPLTTAKSLVDLLSIIRNGSSVCPQCHHHITTEEFEAGKHFKLESHSLSNNR